MTNEEIELAQANNLLHPCCKKRPSIHYEPGMTSIQCDRCGREDALPEFRPEAIKDRWNAMVLGPDEFMRLYGRR